MPVERRGRLGGPQSRRRERWLWQAVDEASPGPAPDVAVVVDGPRRLLLLTVRSLRRLSVVETPTVDDFGRNVVSVVVVEVVSVVVLVVVLVVELVVLVEEVVVALRRHWW